MIRGGSSSGSDEDLSDPDLSELDLLLERVEVDPEELVLSDRGLIGTCSAWW